MREIDIYTDCAGSTGKLGISFVIIENEKETIYSFKTDIESLNKEFFSKNKISNTSIGECYAIYKALDFIKNERDINVKIFTDSYHAFCLLNNLNKVKAKQRRKNNNLLLRLSNKCLNLLVLHTPFIKKGFTLDWRDDVIYQKKEICWVNGHIGNYGNEIANAAAKSALKHQCILLDFDLNILKKVRATS